MTERKKTYEDGRRDALGDVWAKIKILHLNAVTEGGRAALRAAMVKIDEVRRSYDD